MSMASPAELLWRILRQGGVLAATVLIGAAAGVLYGAYKAPTYTADAHVVVVATAAQDDTTAVKFAQAYGRIAGDAAVLAETPLARGGRPVADLRRQVRVATSPDAPLIQVTGSAPDPTEAAQVANQVADSLIAFGNARSGQTRVRVSSFAQASTPDSPTSPKKPLALAVGLAAGVLVGGFATTAGIGAGRRRRPDPPPAPPVVAPAAPAAPAAPVNGATRYDLGPHRPAEPVRTDHGSVS
jgi:capsular polysaccharide biosynthesis protein